MSPKQRLRRPILAQAEQMVAAYMERQRIGRVDLFESKFPEHVAKRKALIIALNNLGLTISENARMMRCARSTIKYWLIPEDRSRRLERRRQLWNEARA